MQHGLRVIGYVLPACFAVLQAQAASASRDFSTAESLFIDAKRPELAVEM